MKAVLIGYGYWGPNIAKNLKASEKFELCGVCDVDPNQLEKAKAIYGESIKYSTNYKDFLEDKDIELVACALRIEVAQEVAREVLKSKKHLFLEKPAAITTTNAQTLKRLRDENGVRVHIDHIMIYNPYIQRIKEIIDSGEIGDVVFFESNRANLGPHIKNDISTMWDLSIHDLAIVDYLMGGEDALKVKAMGIKQFSNKETLTYLNIKYESIIAMIKASWISPVKQRSIVIGGTKKMIVFDDLKESEKIRIYDKGVKFDEKTFGEYGNYEAKVRLGDIYIPYVENKDSLRNSLEHFHEAITTSKKSNSELEQAIRMIEILQKADMDIKEI